MRVWLNDMAVVMALTGMVNCFIGVWSVWAFARRPVRAAVTRPPISILRPLCGQEPELEAALISGFQQIYPEFEIIFGVAHGSDPAAAIAKAVSERFPHIRARLVVDSKVHGVNRKVSNLINMLPEASHDHLLICDSDLHLRPGYLASLADEAGLEGTGLVTALSVGYAAKPCLAARLGITHISHLFLPGILTSRWLGREDCLGSTTLITRDTLARIGGLQAFASVLAEDNFMSTKVRALGLHTRLARCVTTAMVSETSLSALWAHELRWASTIRSVAPLALAGSILQYPIFWALIALLLAPGAGLSCLLLVGVWGARAFACRAINRALQGHAARPLPAIGWWLLPLRDILSVVQLVAAFSTRTVVWRGVRIKALRPQSAKMSGPAVTARHFR